MTDQELEQRLRSWYQAEVPADLAAPADLRARVVAIPRPSRAVDLAQKLTRAWPITARSWSSGALV